MFKILIEHIKRCNDCMYPKYINYSNFGFYKLFRNRTKGEGVLFHDCGEFFYENFKRTISIPLFKKTLELIDWWDLSSTSEDGYIYQLKQNINSTSYTNNSFKIAILDETFKSIRYYSNDIPFGFGGLMLKLWNEYTGNLPTGEYEGVEALVLVDRKKFELPDKWDLSGIIERVCNFTEMILENVHDRSGIKVYEGFLPNDPYFQTDLDTSSASYQAIIKLYWLATGIRDVIYNLNHCMKSKQLTNNNYNQAICKFMSVVIHTMPPMAEIKKALNQIDKFLELNDYKKHTNVLFKLAELFTGELLFSSTGDYSLKSATKYTHTPRHVYTPDLSVNDDYYDGYFNYADNLEYKSDSELMMKDEVAV